ncbi:MAG: hypothetical protein AAF652_11935 [Cyanobacteria bacterium P01_C01_bin.72]
MSDKNMDDLLAQLKSEFEPQPKNQPVSKSPPPSASSMEQMLEELRQELESGRGRPSSRPAESSPPQPLSSSTPAQAPHTARETAEKAAKDRQLLNALIDTDYRRQAHKREQKLAEIKRQEEVKQAEIKRRQQELVELKKQEELRNKRRKAALKEDAKKWLAKLDSRSEEGRWFEEFSYSYENKLQAAIDYLEALRETGL